MAPKTNCEYREETLTASFDSGLTVHAVQLKAFVFTLSRIKISGPSGRMVFLIVVDRMGASHAHAWRFPCLRMDLWKGCSFMWIPPKIPPVFHASCPGPNSISLNNECLDYGPVLPGLVNTCTLLHFQGWQVALNAKISKAFLQLIIDAADCDVHRFLWNDHGQVHNVRFLCVPFGDCSSPFLINATIRVHLAKQLDSPAVRELKETLTISWQVLTPRPMLARCFKNPAGSLGKPIFPWPRAAPVVVRSC